MVHARAARRRGVVAMAVVLAAFTALAVFGGVAEAHGPKIQDSVKDQGPNNYHLEGRREITGQVCGIPVSGWIHEQQQYVYTPSGRLSFHYVANGIMTGEQDGVEVRWILNNHEIDHLLQPEIPPLVSEVPLEQWVAAHPDVIVEIHALYHERWVGKGKGRQLQNLDIFQVNMHDVNVDKGQFVIDCN